ncbi:hypothetical protein ACRZDK_005249 [Klebsiella pneumoniae]|uniref:hypothetical protein n=1 Tax=Klebsiella pneumoniae TaxID=573 RepID=UPI001CEC1A8D|nr:hypothetical protein [Klebsiella pneumoniae]MDU6382943.1 hypothetical protein [Klebsiella pneumoniae]
MMIDLKTIKKRIEHAIKPMEKAGVDEYFWGIRSEAGDFLPPYYLVYFLLVDLLEFNFNGPEEKVAFSIPVKIENTTLIVEYRKMGLGIFIKNKNDEDKAKAILKCIQSGVKAGTEYFNYIADEAAKTSNLNVNNNSNELYDRFCHFFNCYDNINKQIIGIEAKPEVHVQNTPTLTLDNKNLFSIRTSDIFENYNKIAHLRKEAIWYAISAIESFFNWTEHVFILIAILNGKIKTGVDVYDKIGEEWKTKFRLAIDINTPEMKVFYDRLIILRQKIRNFVSHGSFGKDGQTLEFHSSVGAVPLLMPHRQNKEHFKFGNGIDFVAPEAMELLQEFVKNMWSGNLLPAKIYIESGNPLILSYAINGKYANAMSSEDDMNNFVEYLTRIFDDASNMDW